MAQHWARKTLCTKNQSSLQMHLGRSMDLWTIDPGVAEVEKEAGDAARDEINVLHCYVTEINFDADRKQEGTGNRERRLR